MLGVGFGTIDIAICCRTTNQYMSQKAKPILAMKGDRPLDVGTPDRLGFRDVARQIAMSLADRASDNGFVVGLEGRWGSGKSSLLYLIEEELARLSNARKAKEIASAIRKFGRNLGKIGEAIEGAGNVAGIGLLLWFGKVLKIFGVFTKTPPIEPSLIDQKDQLIKSLRELGHRFIITIDDVDRLEPNEVIEVLRLTRSVADFPNVIYVLCYDSEILAHGIEQATKVKSGRDYLEKIVQMTVMVPTPETFQLRHWFAEEITQIAIPKNDDETARLKSVIDIEGGRQLKTPRSVVRALDSIRFLWPPLRDMGGDIADLVWLQIITPLAVESQC